MREVYWDEVAQLFADLTSKQIAESAPQPAATRGWLQHRFRNLVLGLPAPLRSDVVVAITSTISAARAWGGLFSKVLKILAPPAPLRNRGGVEGGSVAESGTGFAASVRADDYLLILGAPWAYPHYAQTIRGLRDTHGVRVAVLVYDIIPLRRPEWFDSLLPSLFRNWIESIVPECYRVFSISRATAVDLESYLAEHRMAFSGPVLTLPIGTGFTAGATPDPEAENRESVLPAAGSYVLVVGTIEVRKNHILMFRVWRRLLEEMDAAQVPTLVFAGRIGWLVQDFLKQIRNTANLGGKLVMLDGPTDGELDQLYSGCMFTVCPSFYEGWGLPVTESLSFGKPCLIANRTSLPEAGGTLVRSFDPDDLNDAYRLIREVIQDPQGLAAWEAKVRREFRPVPWSKTVQNLLEALDISPAEAVISHAESGTNPA